MIPVEGHDNHYSRCVRFNEIDWSAMPVNTRKNQEPVKPGAPMLQIEDLRKYYKVAANEIFGGGEGRVVKANETISFEARESETVAIVGESGCGKSTLAKVLLGLETASSGTHQARQQGHPVDVDRHARRARPCRRSRWCSRTRSTR